MERVTPDVVVTSGKRQAEETKSINIRKVPVSIWLQVRQNALQSRMSFQDYLTMVLADAEPYPVYDATTNAVVGSAKMSPHQENSIPVAALGDR